MGKFDNREKNYGQTSFESNTNAPFPGKGNFKNRKFSKSMPYFSDPLLIPRINQYLSENKDKVYIDINSMVSDLQARYREYGRRKRNVFRVAVQKAFATVLQQCGMEQNISNQDDEYVGSTESSEVEECNISENEDKQTPSSNSQIMNLYKSNMIQLPVKNVTKNSSQNAELIDLSSDDDNAKKKDGGEKPINNNVGNDVLNSTEEPLSTSAPKAGKSDHIVTPSSRKRKFVQNSDRLKLQNLKQNKLPFHEHKVTFADFGGNTKALEEVCKLILHIQHPELYRRIGLSSPRGFLLHGPPGCGKTLLASAIAGELDVHFLKVSAPELIGGVSGESEERIRELFASAVECAPCVLFIDEVDAITPNRQNAQREMERRIVAQLLTCLDELDHATNGDQVLVIGATNRPDSLDPALRRAGRFDREVCLGIPDLKAREQILRVVCKTLKMAPNFSYEEVAENTPGFVGADLLALTREAAMVAINRVFEMVHNQNRKQLNLKRIKLDGVETGKRILSQNEKSSASHNQIDCAISEDTAENDEKDEVTDSIRSPNGNTINVCDKKNGRNSVVEQITETGEKTEDNSIDPVETREENKPKNQLSIYNEQQTEKNDSDMDIAETVSEESENCEIKDIEICKDESVKTVDSDEESDFKSSGISGPPNLETLLSWLRDTPPLTSNQLKSVYLTLEDFKQALKGVQPSAKREGFATVPDVTWDDVGSLADIREELKLSILGPVKLRKQYEQLGLSTPAGILICGPPGCGKTLLAKAVANEAGINFISVKGPELLNMYVGESERAVRQCFQRAKNSAPCVIFFDELDALCPKRSGSGENGAGMRVVNQMLTEMDGVEGRKDVYIMAATNRPDIVDPAVLRPGRLDKILYVGLPEADDRIDILRALTKNGTRPKLASNVNLADIARRQECNGYSGADLAALVREAGVQSLKDLISKSELDSESDIVVHLEHFERALKIVRPSVSPKDQIHYENLKNQYCSLH